MNIVFVWVVAVPILCNNEYSSTVVVPVLLSFEIWWTLVSEFLKFAPIQYILLTDSKKKK